MHPCFSLYQYFVAFDDWIIFYWMDTPYFVNPFISWWTVRLLISLLWKRSLSKGRSLTRDFELQELFQGLLLEKQSSLAAHFSNTEWVTKLAYLCDMFNLINKLNLSLQGRMTTVFRSADKMAAFKGNLELWGQWANTGIADMLQTLAEILKETEPEPSSSQLVHNHVFQLSKEFEHYFPT